MTQPDRIENAYLEMIDFADQPGQQFLAALDVDIIKQQSHLDTTSRRRNQIGQQGSSCLIIVEQIVLDINGFLRQIRKADPAQQCLEGIAQRRVKRLCLI